MRHRSELRALDFQRDALAQRLRSVQAQHLPRIEAMAGANSRGQYLTGAAVEDFAGHNFNVGVLVHLPIFEGWRVTGQASALQAEMRALESSQESVRQAVVLEVKQALALVRSADEEVRASRKGVQAAKLAFETTEARYRTGLGHIVEMTDAQSAYVSANSEELRASYSRRFARAQLGLALGTLTSNDSGS